MFSERVIGTFRKPRTRLLALPNLRLMAIRKSRKSLAKRKPRRKKVARVSRSVSLVSRRSPMEFKCDSCGFIYSTAKFSGVIPDEQAAGWSCPECGAASDHFQLIVPSDELDDATDDEIQAPDVTNEVRRGRRLASIKSITLEVASLRKRVERGGLILQPKFQRYEVWTDKIRSALIESILLELPIPTIYLAEEADGTFVVVDGQQRLSAIFKYMNNEYPLKGLTALRQLNGSLFKQLPEDFQSKIEDRALEVTEIYKETDEAVRFQLFERLNRGSVKLNDQELRNCIYRGSYNDFVVRLARNPILRKALGLKRDQPHPRMVDSELVLRFLAFFTQTYEKHPDKRTGDFLNKQMDFAAKGVFSGADLREQERAFVDSLSAAQTVFGDYMFKRFRPGDDRDRNGSWEPRLNRALMDVVLNTFAAIPKRDIVKCSNEIREASIQLMSTERFSDLLKHTISSADRVRQRFELFRAAVFPIVERRSAGAPTRAYSPATRRQLFESNNKCAECGNAIAILDDVHIDHFDPYSNGGPTALKNAQITHRFCNQSAGARRKKRSGRRSRK